jgi:hypothetical protein
MTCPQCRRKFADSEPRCPHCGQANAKAGGMFQTSTVMISAGGADRVYRSVEEVPAALRSRLLKSTNGANSATILIADRRGRKEIAKAMRNPASNVPRRLMQSLFGTQDPSGFVAWLTPTKRKVILAFIALLALAAVTLVFTRFA